MNGRTQQRDELPAFVDSLSWSLIKEYSWVLLPLAASQLLQRLEHVVDNRFVSALGEPALLIHSVSFNFFLVGQAVGLAAATSALVFWKREECLRDQRGIAVSHVRAAALATVAVAAACAPCLPSIVRQYGIPDEHSASAIAYLGLALLNMILAAVYAPLNALLIASDQRAKSVLNILLLLAVKVVAGALALQASGLKQALIIIAAGGGMAIAALSSVAWRQMLVRASEGARFGFSDMRSVWGSEMGTAAIRSVSPFLYTYFLAKSSGGSSLLVSYQLTLHMAYLLVLPQLAGAQLAVRDASAEQSSSPGGSLLDSGWFRWFFAVSVLPTQALLGLGVLFSPALMKWLYGYVLPAPHVPFVALYFVATAVGQIGNIYLIVLRSMRRNAVATRNFFAAEIGVMVALTGAVVGIDWATPAVLGVIVLAYCMTYLALNYSSAQPKVQPA